jgi:pyruvate,water dikinase
MAEAPSIDGRLDQLSRLDPDDREAIRTISAEIRRTLEGIAIPGDLAEAITRALTSIGEQAAYAGPIERDGGRLAGSLLRRPAGHVTSTS